MKPTGAAFCRIFMFALMVDSNIATALTSSYAADFTTWLIYADKSIFASLRLGFNFILSAVLF